MVTLKEAIALCDVRENEVVYITKQTEYCDIHLQKKTELLTTPMTLREIREKCDMKNMMVCLIKPHFCCGDFEGMEFKISG